MKCGVAFVLFFLVMFSSAHFVLQIPSSIGFSDVNEGTAPCGSFDITSRANASNWPVAGQPVAALTTHPESIFQIRAALENDTNNFVELIPPFVQTGLGYWCLTAVPGVAAWEGLPAVVQVVQFAADGDLYQVWVET